MAYAALVSLAQTSNQILNRDHLPIPLPVDQEIRSIRYHALLLQSFMDDIPEKGNSLKEGIWEVANKAEDVIEHYLMSENEPSQAELNRQLGEVAEKIMLIARDVVDYLNRNRFVNSLGRTRDSRTAASSPHSKDIVVGFAEELVMMKARLREKSRQLKVLPIVGMGGMGKTTLAKIVYDDAIIVKHFHIRAWVTISKDYSVGNIILNLLASMKVRKILALGDAQIEIPNEDQISISNFRNRKYLIVLDDMWSKKAWDDVNILFPDDNQGSRIILTTRFRDVATYTDPSSPIHMMRLLNDDESWRLLKEKVFPHQGCPLELERIGKEIVKNCRGLPLSVVVVGGLLSMIDKTVALWEQIAANDGELEKIISLSYTHLPHHLRACFLYMGGFPEDYAIRVSEFIKLWLAEGFLRYPNGSKSLEEEVEQCLEDLVSRSLVLVTRRKFDGKIKSCSLHDMVRDFCTRQVEQEKLLHPLMDYLPSPFLRRHFLPRVLKIHRRIFVSSPDLNLKDSMHSSRIRTIICNPQQGYKSSTCSVQNFSLLRVFHVLRINDNWDWEPSQVFDLIYLTYLASNIPSSIVPPAISKLQKLQTLIIYGYEVRLPVEIWRMRQLRCLIAFSFHPLPHPEGETFPLENLQTLSLAKNLVCSERIMEMIPNVKKLGLCYSEEKLEEGHYLENLKDLHQLEKLKLEISKGFSSRRSPKPVYPLSLKRLTLSGCNFPWREMWIVGSLPNLEVLKLRNYAFNGTHWNTSAGEFCQLRLLLIDGSNLRHWKSESSHFPVLECLVLHRCPNLYKIPSHIKGIATLKRIEVDDQNTSLLYSAKMIMDDRQSIKDGPRVGLAASVSDEVAKMKMEMERDIEIKMNIEMERKVEKMERQVEKMEKMKEMRMRMMERDIEITMNIKMERQMEKMSMRMKKMVMEMEGKMKMKMV